MSNGYSADLELLAARASAFGGLADRAGRIADDLRGDVEAHGECWGHDEVGEAFAEGHVEAAEAALSGIGALPGGLSDVGSRFSATAATYAESEDTSETAIRGAGRQHV
jgi:hypothetical protein